MPADNPPVKAIVLSGGGARGAYEAGVLRYVFEKLPARLGFVPRFDLHCGTSVGAVHAAYLAAHADEPDEGTKGLVNIWREMAFSRVYSFGVADALNFSRTLTGFALGSTISTKGRPRRIHGLLNTTPLERLVVERIPWRRLRRNIRSGVVGALTVSATEIATGRTIVFVDNRERRLPSWTSDPDVVARPARIGPDHALASAAIPFLFPAVRVGDTYFCDGGLRQVTPLKPALRLGANHVLVIGLRAPTRTDDVAEPPRLRAERQSRFLSAGFLFGKVLNAFLIDPIDNDLSHMRVLNRVLAAGVESFGPEYLDRINARVEPERGLGFRTVHDTFIQPSENIGAIAARHVERLRRGPLKSVVGGLTFRALTRGSGEEEADLMSYLLFDGEYAAELIELGMQDAAREEESLVDFFGDPPS